MLRERELWRKECNEGHICEAVRVGRSLSVGERYAKNGVVNGGADMRGQEWERVPHQRVHMRRSRCCGCDMHGETQVFFLLSSYRIGRRLAIGAFTWS